MLKHVFYGVVALWRKGNTSRGSLPHLAHSRKERTRWPRSLSMPGIKDMGMGFSLEVRCGNVAAAPDRKVSQSTPRCVDGRRNTEAYEQPDVGWSLMDQGGIYKLSHVINTPHAILNTS